MAVHAERRGRGPRLALVHGFTQTSRSWDGVADDLATDHELVLLDAPGHGESTEVRADLVTASGLLARSAGPSTWIGYSMGARLCLHVAVHHPEAAQGLVLLGATAGIEDDTERAARRAQDQATAARLAEEGVDAFLEGWLAQPLFAGLPRDQAGLGDRRRNTVAGLSSSLELAGTGSQEPPWERLAGIAVPVLAMAGAEDARYAALAERIAASVGGPAEVALVPGAGHAAHLEQPAAFLAAVRPWLARHGL